MLFPTYTKALLLASGLLQTAQGAAVTRASDSTAGFPVQVSPDGVEYITSDVAEEVTLNDGTIMKFYHYPEVSENPVAIVKRDLTKRQNWCDGSSFINQTSMASPDFGDCEIIRARMRANPQTFRVPVSISRAYLAIVSYQTCVFGAYNQNYGGALIGNDDIADLVRDTTVMFTWNKRMGARGEMKCEYM